MTFCNNNILDILAYFSFNIYFSNLIYVTIYHVYEMKGVLHER